MGEQVSVLVFQMVKVVATAESGLKRPPTIGCLRFVKKVFSYGVKRGEWEWRLKRKISA